MKNLKRFKQFEAFINKYGKLVNMDWTNESDYKDFERMVLSLIDENTFISKNNYYKLPLKFQEIYQKICVDKDVIYYNEILIIEDILIHYPNECKECLVKNIISNIIFEINELPYYSQVIEVLPIDYQKLIISTILKNSNKFYINNNQYEAFNIKIQKIIDFNKDRIIIY
jgi:hypothetical protein